jgi:general secretion pathway protein B
MSLILEALKKSEAERRIGQAPGLSTPTLMRVRRRRARWPAVLAVALLALLLALAGLYWRTASREPATTTVAASPAPTPAVAAPNAAVVEAEPAAPGPIAAPSPAVADRAASARPASTPAPVPQDPEFASIERESIALPAAEQAPTFRPPATPAPIVPHADGGIATPSLPALEALPRLRDLPASQRDALPPLKLSMHVYTEDPATRFALIDGRRVGEGATLGKALRVEQIRRDGAVLDFDGTRFILPRP